MWECENVRIFKCQIDKLLDVSNKNKVDADNETDMESREYWRRDGVRSVRCCVLRSKMHDMRFVGSLKWHVDGIWDECVVC
jgi:hypothetical protein